MKYLKVNIEREDFDKILESKLSVFKVKNDDYLFDKDGYFKQDKIMLCLGDDGWIIVSLGDFDYIDDEKFIEIEIGKILESWKRKP